MWFVFLLLSSVAAITFTQFTGPFVQKLDAQTIRIKYVPSNRGTPVIYGAADIGSANNISISYDVFFEPNFVWQLGGKLPGVTGGAKNIKSTGCVAVDPRVFSFRPMWRQNGRLQMYMYSQNRTLGDACGIGPSTPSNVLPINRWFRLTLEMGLNRAQKSDGFGRLLIDGKKVLEVTQIRWLDVPSSINTFLFTTFYGGHDPSWSPPHITYSRMRNLTIGFTKK